MTELVCISPVDGREFVRRPLSTHADVERAAKRARKAQRGWAQVPLEERCAVMLRFLAAMETLNPEIVPELAWQMGRPVRYGGELRSLAERVRGLVEIAPGALAPELPESGDGIVRRVDRVPVGLVLVVAPWNYPFLTAANTIVAALLAGNAVLLKPSAQTPLAGERFAQALDMAGLPPGLFTNLFLGHETVMQALGDALVDHATFTGSVAGGRAIGQAASLARRGFPSLTLELGGKDPAYVRADADLEGAVEGLVDGSFFNSGQSCCAVERLYVHEAVWQPFLDGFVEATLRYRLGDPLDPETSLGPMATAKVATRVRDQVMQARQAGATAHIDPKCFPADKPGSAWLMPQVLTGVDHQMAVMREETFGPVVGLIKVKDDEEALQLMNDSDYGLAASIWTQDLETAERLAVRVEAGTVLANRCDYLDPDLAWTGIKESGRGASLGRWGFESVTRPQSLHMRSAR